MKEMKRESASENASARSVPVFNVCVLAVEVDNEQPTTLFSHLPLMGAPLSFLAVVRPGLGQALCGRVLKSLNE